MVRLFESQSSPRGCRSCVHGSTTCPTTRTWWCGRISSSFPNWLGCSSPVPSTSDAGHYVHGSPTIPTTHGRVSSSFPHWLVESHFFPSNCMQYNVHGLTTIPPTRGRVSYSFPYWLGYSSPISSLSDCRSCVYGSSTTIPTTRRWWRGRVSSSFPHWLGFSSPVPSTSDAGHVCMAHQQFQLRMGSFQAPSHIGWLFESHFFPSNCMQYSVHGLTTITTPGRVSYSFPYWLGCSSPKSSPNDCRSCVHGSTTIPTTRRWWRGRISSSFPHWLGYSSPVP